MLARVVRLTAVLVLSVALPVLTAGCGEDSPTAPSNYAPFSHLDIRVGTGDEAVSGLLLTVKYTGWFYDGSVADHRGVQFATSLESGPAEFVLGTGGVIEGWEQGIPGMKVGGLRRLVIPPSLAYGQSRYSAIPPNVTLVFDVELVSAVVPE
jgi:FKBP-type peptidyl-prolyl cis-trans isomerase FkpA